MQLEGSVYLYTQFEAFDANQMFPSFDQPDLKATFQLTVTAPVAWQVISTAKESKPPVKQNERQEWNFPETAKISTYVFSLHAGPYHVWQDKAGDIPLRLFSRESMAKYIIATDWFDVTKKGLAFYADYFKVAYPFGKYDQVIVPDFNFGAMENAGAVTFAETYIKRGKQTQEDWEHTANVVLHEMAHMWFGDLVTMKWWNGLWLNESFATYMAALTSKQTGVVPGAWASFIDAKNWAYFEDQLVTTHPIEGPVKDTNTAFVNFDGITYAKGASSIKQLAYYLGEENFRNGLRMYFQRHQYQNTSIADFLQALSEPSQADLKTWGKQWLETAGLDTVRAQFTCENGKVTKFELELTPPKTSPIFRPHRTLVALYDTSPNGLRPRMAIPVTYSAAKTPVPSAVGLDCPAAVFPNYEDYDYVKVWLDESTLKTVSQDLSAVKDDLTRIMFWTTLYEMVRDGKLAVQDYGTIVLRDLPKEMSSKGILAVTRTLYKYGKTISYFPKKTTTEKELRSKFIEKLESLLWTKVASSGPGSDLQYIWFDTLVAVTESKAQLDRLAGLLNGTESVKGLTVDQDRRWNVIAQLSAFGHPAAAGLLEAERKKDTSERGSQEALRAEASTPNITKKKSLLDDLLRNQSLSHARTRSILKGFFPANQAELRGEFESGFYSKLPGMVKTRDPEFLEEYVENMLPARCSPESVKGLTGFLKSAGSLPPVVTKPLKIGRQEDERCVRVRKKASETLLSRSSPGPFY